MDVKDDLTMKSMNKYFKTSYEIFKNAKFRAPKEDYKAAIDYFTTLMQRANKPIPGIAEKGSNSIQRNCKKRC